ncbi:hypothetical protein LTR35_010117 [Friedmanniomyces endolithicus]|nr:hypothetical protein LTR35_010117 [Friedmanniomyces endolithicus]
MPAWEGWREDALEETLAFEHIAACRHAVAQDHRRRGQIEQFALTASQGPHGPGAKKGKKRASTTSTPHGSKPRKKSTVSDDLVIKKAVTHKDGGAGTAPVEKPDIDKQAMTVTLNLPSPMRKRKRAQMDEGTGIAAQGALVPTRLVRIYANETSMDSVYSGSQRTSLAALNASSKYGATLYDSNTAASIQQDNVAFARSLLSSPAALDHAQSSGRVHGTAEERLHDDLGDALGSLESAARRQLSPMEEDDERDIMLETLAEDIDTSPVVQTPFEFTAETAGQLPTPAASDAPEQIKSVGEPNRPGSTKASRPQSQTEEDFMVLDSAEDHAMAEAFDIAENVMPRRSPTPPPRDRRQNVRDAQPDDDYGGALLTATEKDILAEAHRTHRISSIRAGSLAYLRRDELHNLASLLPSWRSLERWLPCRSQQQDVLLELYARVTESRREGKPGRHQHLVFHDLYHDKPPYLTGTYDLWDQSRLWELDSRVFVKPKNEGVICRVIARMKRDGMKWKLEVLSIWEASRDDVEHVARIYVKASKDTLNGDSDE